MTVITGSLISPLMSGKEYSEAYVVLVGHPVAVMMMT